MAKVDREDKREYWVGISKRYYFLVLLNMQLTIPVIFSSLISILPYFKLSKMYKEFNNNNMNPHGFTTLLMKENVPSSVEIPSVPHLHAILLTFLLPK